MKKIPPVRHFFRKPVYPVIIDIKGTLICGFSASTLARRLSKLSDLEDQAYRAIDSTGEGWSFYSVHWILTPLTLKKRWTKLEIIRLFNDRKNKNPGNCQYSEKSLSSKRLVKIIYEIVELLDKT